MFACVLAGELLFSESLHLECDNPECHTCFIGELEWLNGLQHCAVACMVMGSNPHQFLGTHDLQVHGSERLGCHAELYTVSRCHTTGKSEDHTGEKAHKGSTLALKLTADVTGSPKQGYQRPHKKDLCFPKNFKQLDRKSLVHLTLQH